MVDTALFTDPSNYQMHATQKTRSRTQLHQVSESQSTQIYTILSVTLYCPKELRTADTLVAPQTI